MIAYLHMGHLHPSKGTANHVSVRVVQFNTTAVKDVCLESVTYKSASRLNCTVAMAVRLNRVSFDESYHFSSQTLV